MSRRFVSLAAVAALVALPLSASTFLARSESELVAGSRAVIQGAVLDVRSFWNDERTVIVSEARVLVDELVAGEAPSLVVVRTFGGRVGDVVVEAHGFPTFRAGEEVLLFLSPDDEDFRVTGYQRGQYRIRETAWGRLAVPADQAGARYFTRDGRPASPPRPERLEPLKERLREHERARADLRPER